MSEIILSKGVRSNLLQLQNTAHLVELTQTRLATGKKVNTALDNPTNFFTAETLYGRAKDLSALLDSIGQAQKVLEAVDVGIGSITKLVQSAQATARQAQQSTDAADRASLAGQFDDILVQINLLAGDATYNGTNLLNGDDLIVVLNEDGTSTQTVAGVNFTTGGDLAIANSVGSWAADADIQTSLDEIVVALATLRTQAKNFGSSLATVQTRQDFTKAMINTLTAGADSLTLADSNEEGANLLALQTRQQLSTTALSLAAQADQNVLRLFG